MTGKQNPRADFAVAGGFVTMHSVRWLRAVHRQGTGVVHLSDG